MRFILPLIAALLAVQTAAADATGVAVPPPGGLEQRLFADAADGRLDEFSPLGAALVASGTADAGDLLRYERKGAALADLLRSSGAPGETPRQRAETVFEFMHRRVLAGGYDLKNTDLRRTLDAGYYNCVTATVLFNYLADELGLDGRGLQMPGHAMSRLMLADGPLDVETTCPRWFQLKDSPAAQTAAAAGTIGAAAAADRTKARLVSPIQLAAMIYYNRGIDLLAEGRFAEAVAANQNALRLDPANDTARGNLLASINNWSIELGNRGRHAEAAALLRQGMALDPRFEAFAQNFAHVHRQWVERLCREERFEEALNVLSHAAAERPDLEYFSRARNEVSGRLSKAPADPRSEHRRQMPYVISAPRVD